MVQAARIAFAVEAAKNQNTVLFHLVEEAIRKVLYSCAPLLPMDYRELQGKFRDKGHGIFNSPHKPEGERRAYVCIPLLGLVELSNGFITPYNG
jgi:hypothetical protein